MYVHIACWCQEGIEGYVLDGRTNTCKMRIFKMNHMYCSKVFDTFETT